MRRFLLLSLLFATTLHASKAKVFLVHNDTDDRPAMSETGYHMTAKVVGIAANGAEFSFEITAVVPFSSSIPTIASGIKTQVIARCACGLANTDIVIYGMPMGDFTGPTGDLVWPPPVAQVPDLPESKVTNLVTDLAGKAAVAHTHVKANISDFAHTHAESEVTNLVSDLAGKAASSHTHAESDVTNLVADLAAKADYLTFGSTAPPSCTVAGVTTFVGTAGATAVETTIIRFIAPVSLTASKFFVKIGGNVPASETATFAVMKNTVATTLTCAIGSGASTCSDVNAAHNFTVVAGDLIDVRLICTGGTTSLTASVSTSLLVQ